jgi:hypothetical protein
MIFSRRVLLVAALDQKADVYGSCLSYSRGISSDHVSSGIAIEASDDFECDVMGAGQIESLNAHN